MPLSRLFFLSLILMITLSPLALAQDPITLGSVVPPRAETTSSSVAAAPASLLDLQEKLLSLETSLQDQTQQIEEMQKTIRALEQKIDQKAPQTTTLDQPENNEETPKVLPESNAVEPSAEEKPSPSDAPTDTPSPTLGQATHSKPLQDTPTPPSSEADAYQTGIDTLKQGQYAKARNHFEAFVKNNPNDTLLPNAYYWIGETYYAEGNYRQSGEMFLKSFQDYPDSPKAPDSLLKLGLSLQSAKQTKQACQSFAELLRRYPKANPGILHRAKRAQAACL